ncbi:MAG: CARDB domain-containing protein [bacterium]|nr:CARDB domain-containing protein [bacterium]
MSRWKILMVSLLLLWSNQVIGQQTAIDRGVEWLVNAQNPNGSWGTETDYPNVVFRNTCLVADTLCYLDLAGSPTTLNAIGWIEAQLATSTRHLTRQIIPLVSFGTNTTKLANLLVSYQNEDAGWSGYNFKGADSFVLDTLLALSGLKSANYSNNTVIEPGLWYLISNQNTDGGWGFTKESGSNVYLTSLALLTLNQYRKDYYLEEAITKASNWLITQIPEFLWEKALMYSSLIAYSLQLTATLDYILSNQLANGSWDNDPFTTALCLRAIKDSMPPEIFIDLEAKYLSYSPGTPSAGDTILLKSCVFNSGSTTLTGIESQFYINTSTLGPILFIPRLEPGEYATVSLSLSSACGTYTILALFDPRNLITEQSENNNTTITTLIVSEAILSLPDLIFTKISVSNLTPQAGEIITISATITNTGESSAKNVLVQFLDNGIQLNDDFIFPILHSQQEAIAELEVSFAEGSHNISVVADPYNTISEQDETNNIATTTIIAEPAPLSDLAITQIIISPDLPNSLSTITITALIRNLGEKDANQVSVRLYNGNPEWKNKIGEVTIGSITPQGTSSAQFKTQLASGTHTLWLVIDEGNIIAEINETNNSASVGIYVQPIPCDLVISNISFFPSYPTDRDEIKVTVAVLNQGEADVENLFVKVMLDSIEIKEFGIAQLKGQETKNLFFICSSLTEGTHTFTFIADPDNLIPETNEANNTFTTKLRVREYLKQPPQVVCVPWASENPLAPHDTWIGKETTLKGTAHDLDGDHTMLTYKWEFGDGYSTSWISPVDPYIIEAKHTYTGIMSDGTPYTSGKYFTASLYIKDQDDLIGKDTYFIAIRDKSLDIEVNVAIDEGLWWLHKQQNRAVYEDGAAYGCWSHPDYGPLIAYTAAAVEAFELMGHLPKGYPYDITEDPYIETVQRGLNYLFNHFYTYSISQDSTYCPLGNPDMNGNGIGLTCYDYRELYDTGMSLMTLSSSGAPNRIALTGSPNVKGRTYKEIAQDMVDCLAWGQTDPYAEVYEGGWRYSLNYGQSDNSVSQWPVIGMESAERNLKEAGLKVPDFVRPELLKWLSYSQNANGGFGYSSPDDWVNTAKTGAGCAMLSWAGVETSDNRFQRALSFLNNDWYNTNWSCTNFGDYYTMYGIMKGMRIPDPDVEVIRSHNWYSEYARYIIDEQNKYGDGYVVDTSWLGEREVKPILATAWAIAILVPTPVTPPPVADAGADIDNHPPLITVRFNGNNSYHRDPTKKIVIYEWDFESDGVYDISSSEPYATYTYPAYDLNGSPTTVPDKIDWAKTARDYQVRLRVSDDNIPPLTDTDECIVHITPPPWPPVADAGGPYQGTKNTTLILDGSRSYDPNGKMYPSPGHPWHGYITGWLWDLDNDGKYDDASTEKVEWKISASGIYPVSLKVINNFNETDCDNAVINIENRYPTADAGGPYLMAPDGRVRFDGSASSDPDYDPLLYRWDFTSDGIYDTPFSPEKIATHTYSEKIEQTVTLCVYDGSDYDVATATVYPKPLIFSSVATDKLFYSANEHVTIISKAKSLLPGIILYNLPLRIEIDGEIIDKEIPALFPKSLWSSNSYWNTGTHTPGKYTITQTVFYGTEALSVATCTFAILSDLAGISGDIDVTPYEVKTYGSLTFNYVVTNTGNTDLINLPLNILIIDPDTGELKHTLTDVATITSGASYTNTIVWDNLFLKEPKIYLAILQAGTKSLDSDTFRVLPFGFLYGKVEGYAYSRALDFAIYTEKEQTYLGGGGNSYTFVLGGSVHSNTKATINNKKHRIVEPKYVNDSPIIGLIPGQANLNYSGDIPFPTIDWQYYRQIAKEQNRYYTSLTGVNLPQGKDQVTVVELSKEGGELKFSGNSKGEGTLILWTQDTEKLELKLGGTVDFKGLIYTNGQIELLGNVKIKGSIIAKSATLNGTPRVFYNPVNLWQNRIPITDALITARDETTGKTQTTTTTSSGTYTLPYLPAGTYTLTAQKEGYISSSTTGAIIRVNEGTEVNFVVIQERLTRLLTAPESQIDEEEIIPTTHQLLQSFPNPANNGCYIPFQLRVDSDECIVNIYNIVGQKVREINAGPKKAGSYTEAKEGRAIFWDMKNDQGQKVSSGLYFYKLKAGEFSNVKALVIKR